MVYVFLADGFEEIEAVAPIDILRRLNIPVTIVGVTGKSVKGSHNICIDADISIDQKDFEDATALVLPGGMPGTTNLLNNDKLCQVISEQSKKGKIIAALCAAPSILSKLGLLKARDFTCYPGFEKNSGGNYKNLPLVISEGKFTLITAWGPGAAYRFGFALAEKITGENVDNLKASMMMCGD
ncbi:MAG: DJ-1/PfpI family protein [Ruminococcaceae bacterium]|nr:DJ-1/PfpI family protein [Oscillospiraceae bacterium]